MLSFNVINRPYFSKELKSIEKKFISSETSYRNNFDSLVKIDFRNGNNFATSKLKKSILIENSFPFRKREISFEKSKKISAILNDSSSYKWGETGTPVYNYNLYFYDENDKVIGISLIDLGGGIKSYPYRSFMKWGGVSEKALNLISNDLNLHL